MLTNSDIGIRTATIDDLAAIFHLSEKVFTSQEFSQVADAAEIYRRLLGSVLLSMST